MNGHPLAAGPPFRTLLWRAALLAVVLPWSFAQTAEAQRLPIALYSTRDGLPHYVVNRIVAEPQGEPSWGWNQMALQDRSRSWWFGTNQGLLRYPPGVGIRDLARTKPLAWYSRASGLAPDVVLRLFEDARGDVWVSTVGHGARPNGLSVWRRNPPHTLVQFTERDGLLRFDQYYVSSFASDRGGRVWIGFSGDAGIDPDWIGAAEARSVSYAGIAPGSYTLGIRALATGCASPEVVTATFMVVPPLWRRPAFLLPLAVAAALLAYAAYRLRLRRALELANMRTRIATDLHDDIGADLTRIGILSEVVRHQLGPGNPEDPRLASIARLARESVGAMSDIVWAINPERDTLADLARKLRGVAEDLTAASGLDLTLLLPSATTSRLDMDVRRDLFLICKEALTNAVRHAGARRLCLSLREDGSRLSLEMTDDGVGFDAGQSYEGHGLISMGQRAERLGASLSVRSEPGRGTTVRVDLPLRRGARSRRLPTSRSR